MFLQGQSQCPKGSHLAPGVRSLEWLHPVSNSGGIDRYGVFSPRASLVAYDHNDNTWRRTLGTWNTWQDDFGLQHAAGFDSQVNVSAPHQAATVCQLFQTHLGLHGLVHPSYRA